MTPLLERDQELLCLQKAAEAATGGRGQIVQIAGEAGIGKSRLIEEFCERLPTATAAAIGICQKFDQSRPLGPLFDMSLSLGQAFRDAVTAAKCDTDPFTKVAAEIERLGPGVVLVFDDAQDADAATLDLLHFLCMRVSSLKALIVISYRCDEVSKDHPLTFLLGRCPSRFTSRLNIAPLSAAAIDELARLLNAPPDGIFDRSGGNLFLALKCLRDPDGQPGSIPQAIIQWARARLAIVPTEEREWINLLAYLPVNVGRKMQIRLAEAFDYPLDKLSCQRGFLVETPDGLIGFRHEIVREAILASVSNMVKQDACARLLDTLCTDGDLAETYSSAVVHLAMVAGYSDLVVKHAPVAARQSEAIGDYRGAALILFKALPFARNIGPEAYAPLVELWVCRTSVSENITEEMLAEVNQANARWTELNEPVLLARNQLLLCRLHRYRSERDLAKTQLRLANSLLKKENAGSDLALAEAIQAQMALEERQNEEAFVLAKTAAKTARSVNDQISRIDALVTMATVMQRQCKPRGKKLMAAMRRMTESLNLHELTARIHTVTCDQALSDLDLPGAEQCIRQWADAKRYAPQCWKSALSGREALVLVLQGKLDEGGRLARHLLDDSRNARSMQFLAALALALSQSRQQAADADAALAEAQLLANESGDPRNIAIARLCFIEHAFLEGRVEDALAVCNSLDVPTPEMGLSDIHGLLLLWRMRLERILGHEGGLVSGIQSISAASHSDYPETAAEFSALGYAFEAALAKLFVDGPDAARLMEEAVAEFTTQGAKAGLNCVHRIAQARGIVLSRKRRERGPYRASRTHALGLTRREVEVLRMMVDGTGNREIADHLGRSLRTVEHHVSAILGKMGFDSRMQAVLFAIAHPDIIDLAEDFR